MTFKDLHPATFPEQEEIQALNGKRLEAEIIATLWITMSVWHLLWPWLRFHFTFCVLRFLYVSLPSTELCFLITLFIVANNHLWTAIPLHTSDGVLCFVWQNHRDAKTFLHRSLKCFLFCFYSLTLRGTTTTPQPCRRACRTQLQWVQPIPRPSGSLWIGPSPAGMLVFVTLGVKRFTREQTYIAWLVCHVHLVFWNFKSHGAAALIKKKVPS